MSRDNRLYVFRDKEAYEQENKLYTSKVLYQLNINIFLFCRIISSNTWEYQKVILFRDFASLWIYIKYDLKTKSLEPSTLWNILAYLGTIRRFGRRWRGCGLGRLKNLSHLKLNSNNLFLNYCSHIFLINNLLNWPVMLSTQPPPLLLEARQQPATENMAQGS